MALAWTLTIAVAVMLLVPALVGFWREPRRGVLALAGTLLGDSLADFWAARWGQDLAQSLGGQPNVMTLFVSCALLAFCSIVIGYGGGILMPPATKLPLPRRLLGGLLGLLNGGLIAGYTLRYAVTSSPGFAEEMLTIPLADAIYKGLPWFFLILAIVLAALIIVRRIIHMLRRPAPAKPVTPAPSAPTAPMSPPASNPAAPAKDVQRKSVDVGPKP